MTDHCLKFPDEMTATEALIQFEGVREVAIDTIGTIEDADGWHVNLRITDDEKLSDELLEYEVFPETPARVWF